jgi:hypothetical protein
MAITKTLIKEVLEQFRKNANCSYLCHGSEVFNNLWAKEETRKEITELARELYRRYVLPNVQLPFSSSRILMSPVTVQYHVQTTKDAERAIRLKFLEELIKSNLLDAHKNTCVVCGGLMEKSIAYKNEDLREPMNDDTGRTRV